MRKIFVFIVVFAIACNGTSLFAQSEELSQVGLKMLTVEAGARPAGMGGAFSSISGDPISAAYNPAATFGVTRVTTALGYNTHWENTRIETGYISFQKRSVVITAGIQYGAADHLQARVGPTEDYTEFSFHDVSAKVGAAFEIDSSNIIGFALGMMYEKNDIHSGSAFNFDLGVLMTPSPRLSVGFAVLNFGSTMKVYDESYDIPTTYRGGFSYKFNNLVAAIDGVYLDSDFHVNMGGEYNLNENFFIRGGYRFGYDSIDMSAGLGFVKRNIRIDYAFLPYKEGLNDSHTFNLTFEI